MERIMELINGIKNVPIETWINLLIAVLIVVFFFVFRRVFAYIVIKVVKFKTKERKKIKEMPFFKPLSLFFAIWGVYLAALFLKIPTEAMAIVTKIFRIAVIMLVANGLANTFRPETRTIQKIQTRMGSEERESQISFICKIIRAVIYILAGFIVIIELGYNINGLIAGVGLGGVIITLAAQDTAKNLFGGMVLLFDKPFVVGDWIQTTNFEGIVEDITFRSTRVRTFENSVVTIPNAVLANESIINWSKMEKRRYKIDLKLSLDTPMQTVQKTIDRIYTMLINHQNVINEDTYVKFDEIKEDGINIMIYAFTNSIDYDSYLEAKEHINTNIMEILEHENVKLAYPTKTVYVKH